MLVKTAVRLAVSDRVRSCVLFTLTLLILIQGAITATRAQVVDVRQAVAQEHRFSVLEEKVYDMTRDITEIKETINKEQRTDWIKMLALALLTGEAGIRTFKKKGESK